MIEADDNFNDAVIASKHAIGYSVIERTILKIDDFIPNLENVESILVKSFDISCPPVYSYAFNEPMNNQKQYLINFVIEQVQKEYPSLILNRSRLARFANLIQPFNMKTFLEFIDKTYSDTELITINQLQDFIINNMVGTYKSHTIENIKDYTSTGIEFDVSLYRHGPGSYVNAIAKFAQIVLSGTCHTETTGFNIVNIGETYLNTELKYIKVFKKGILKVRFESEEARDKFKECLYKSPEEILGRPKVEQLTVPLGICDTCLFKNYKCESCENNNKWVGDCNYCLSYVQRFISSSDCPKCQTGERNHFNLIQVSKTPELETFWQSNKPSWA